MGAGRLEEAHFQEHNSLSKISQITTSPKPQISVDLSNDDACEEHSAHHSHEITQNVDQFINSIAAIDDKSSSSPDITDFIENFSKIIESRVKKYNSSDTGTRFVKMTEEDLLFIHSVRRISKLTHALSEFPQDSSVNPSMNQTSAALQRAMVFLEEEFRALLEDFMFKLGVFSPEILIEKVTDGEYDQGEWFPVLVRACSSVVIKDRKMLPDVELADTVGCDAYELGRMINGLIDYFDLKLPEFDIVTAFERTFKSSPSFLVQCLIKWFVTTGRRPMPVVAAVLVFVAELNQVDVKIEEVASRCYVQTKV